MRKSLTILAACGLALGVAACGKHDDAAQTNLSESDNMLVPADENVAGAGLDNGAGNNAVAADPAAAGNDATVNATGNAQ